MQLWQRPDARLQVVRHRLGGHDRLYQPHKKEMHRATHKQLFMKCITIEDSYLDKIRAIDKLINTGALRDIHQWRKLITK